MSKKYKLKKRYPSLPKSWKVGEIVKQSYGPHCYSSTSDNIDYRINIPKDEVENNPEFWEEVKEKEYEILSFINEDGETLLPRYSSGLFGIEYGYCTEQYFIDSSNHSIYAVKRLSDGEVFIIGDTIQHRTTENIGQILSININCGKIYFSTTYLKLKTGTALYNATHYKEPLFTTEDGVDIYEGDKFCVINSANDRIFDRLGGDGLFYKSEQVRKRCFSTKKKAQEWIDLNKSQYSKADITNAVHAIGELGYNHHSNKTCLILQADDLFKELKI